MAQLGRFEKTILDTSGNALSGVSVTLYREGATVNGNQSGTTPITVTVRDNGKIAASDTVFINTTTGTTYTVDSITDTTVVLSGFAGTLNLTSGDRLVPSNSQPTLYSDDQGGATTTNPLTTNSSGYAHCWMHPNSYDYLVSGGGAATTLYQGQVVGGELEAFGIISVKDYGAKGDDSTDDTTAIQAALTDLRNTPAILYFPPGTYKITAALTLGSMNQRVIRGAGRSVSIIKQYTANTPIISITESDSHSITLEDMELAYSSQQTSGQTSAIALNLSGGDAYYWHINRVVIRNSNTGIGISGSGQIPWWGSVFENMRIIGITLRGINLTSPTAIGMPANVFRQIQINNTNLATVNTGEAIKLSAQSGCTVDGLDIEDWVDTAIYCIGGGSINFRGTHLERMDLVTNADHIIRIEDEGNYSFDSFVAITIDVNVATSAQIFYFGADARVVINGMRVTNTTLTSGVLRLMTGTTPKQIVFVTEPALDANVSQPATGDATRDFLTLYGSRYCGIISTFTANDATPSVAYGSIFKTANTVGTTITAFDNGIEGQTIQVIINDTNTTIDFTGTTLIGNTGADWTPTTNDHMICTYDGTNWYCRISDNTV